MVFQLVRNTTAIWRNAARYCWFKMDLFHFKAVHKTCNREKKQRCVRGYHRMAILLPQPLAIFMVLTHKLCPEQSHCQ